MLNIKSILSQSLLALAMLVGSAAALAGPMYHVSIDTSTLGSGAAYLDLTLGSLAGSAPASATLSNFEGVFGAFSDRLGDSSGSVDGTVVLGNSQGFNDLFQEIVLGGLFGFDISFESAIDSKGIVFGAALYADASAGTYLGLPGDLVQISVTPGEETLVSPANAFASAAAVAEVPEPSTLLSLFTGIGLLGFTLRRRAR